MPNIDEGPPSRQIRDEGQVITSLLDY